MLKHAKGNLLDLAVAGHFDLIVQGCNCQVTMGSGIAKEIRERFPEAYQADIQYLMDIDGRRPAPVFKLGNYSMAPVYGQGRTLFTIINAYTQVHYLPRGVDHFEYESFKIILRKLLVAYGDRRFGFPYIGMGLAGGNKERIMKILEGFATAVDERGGSVTLVEFG